MNTTPLTLRCLRSALVGACSLATYALLPGAGGALALLLATLAFVLADRHVWHAHARLAERLASSFVPLLLIASLWLACLPWPSLAGGSSYAQVLLWLLLAAAGLALLDSLPFSRPRPSRALLAGETPGNAAPPDCRVVVQLPLGQALDWLTAQTERPVETIVLSDVHLSAPEAEQVLQLIQRHGLQLRCAADQSPPLGAWTAFDKRLFDILLATYLLLMCLPVLVLAALAVRLQDGGPALFRQPRLGQHGRCIRLLKLRSMQVAAGADDSAPQARANDPRITPLGHWLRRCGIDELPQLLNVLRGDMSLIGPRPHALAHDLAHGASLPGYYARQGAKPGITGLAQVRGLRGEIRTHADIAARLAADLEYVRRQSLLLDLWILTATPLVLARDLWRMRQEPEPQEQPGVGSDA